MNNFQYKTISVVMTLILLLSMAIIGKETASYVNAKANQEEKKECIVVIDPGHGGIDPGKVGVNGTLEKEINLDIALKLNDILKNSGICVVMTRRTDDGLYDEDSDNKKIQDMKRRVSFIEEHNPKIVVSIHQNSFTQSSVHGAQCFYHEDSEEGKKLASSIQKNIGMKADTDDNRQIKSDNTYYLLKNTSIPTVIVECGFLSNPEDEKLLLYEEYRARMAWAIYMGIIQYLND